MSVRSEWELECPECKKDTKLVIFALVGIKLCANGTETVASGHEWDGDSTIECNACGWQGTVKQARMSVEADWPDTDQLAAQAQGWDIFDCSGSADGRWQLQAIAVPTDHPHLKYKKPKFKDDAAAAAFVRKNANKGDKLAQRAIAFLIKMESGDVKKFNLRLPQ